jgi:hypothetical protein
MSHILRSVYSGAFENMDAFCDTFVERSKEVRKKKLAGKVTVIGNANGCRCDHPCKFRETVQSQEIRRTHHYTY